MKKEKSIPSVAVLGAIQSQPKIYTVTKPYQHDGKPYEIDYQFKDAKDENGHYQKISIKTYKLQEGKRIETGGSYNTVMMHFVNHVLNTEACRKDFEAWLTQQIALQNN